MTNPDQVVEVEAYVKALADKPQVTLHLDRDPNDPRVPKGTVLQSLRKGATLRKIFNSKNNKIQP